MGTDARAVALAEAESSFGYTHDSPSQTFFLTHPLRQCFCYSMYPTPDDTSALEADQGNPRKLHRRVLACELCQVSLNHLNDAELPASAC